ncbi:glycosyltransferase family 9 protein, partial [Candidatus Poribacteria bacterium]|nr:glycosyltransferase family 9 protein [Candidatus Poribacteria bacterium]
ILAMERILLIRFGSLGDVVLTTPVIRELRKKFPNAYISMLVGDRFADIVSANPHLNDVIPFQRGKKNPQEIMRVASLLKEREFDISIDMQKKFRSSLLAYLGGVKLRIGYHQPKGFLCNVKIPDKGNEHSIDRNLDLLKPLGITTADRQTEMFIRDEDREYADSFFKAKGLLQSPMILGLFPGASWRNKCWPPERFSAIGDLAIDKYKAEVIIFGGPDEMDIVDSVAKNMKNPVVTMKNRITILQLGAMIQKCNLFISNDTGPMHISVAFDIPTIGIFGPGNHIKFQPIGQKHTIIRKNVPCRPCKQFTNKCKDNVCMKLITVDDVWEKVCQMLS